MRVVHGVVRGRRRPAQELDGPGGVGAVADVVDAGFRAAEGLRDVPGVVGVDGRGPGVGAELEGVGRCRGGEEDAGSEAEEGGGGVAEVGCVGLDDFGLVAGGLSVGAWYGRREGEAHS